MSSADFKLTVSPEPGSPKVVPLEWFTRSGIFGWKPGRQILTALIDRATSDASPAQDSFFRRRGTDLAVNVSLLAMVWVAYSAVRGVTAGEVATAMGNAANLLHFQDLIGMPSELTFQQNLLSRTHVLRGANIYYVTLHFPATVLFLSWAWLNHRDHFARVRNTLLGVTLSGLVVHVAYPLAPPRMIRGFVDTAAVLGPNPYDLKISAAANQIAAMPSLHVGWALIVALGIVWILESRCRYLALLHPVLTAGVVVVTANHYWTDAIVAATLVLAGWLVFRPRGRVGRP